MKFVDACFFSLPTYILPWSSTGFFLQSAGKAADQRSGYWQVDWKTRRKKSGPIWGVLLLLLSRPGFPPLSLWLFCGLCWLKLCSFSYDLVQLSLACKFDQLKEEVLTAEALRKSLLAFSHGRKRIFVVEQVVANWMDSDSRWGLVWFWFCIYNTYVSEKVAN